MSDLTVTLPSAVVDEILSALHNHAGELAAREARRTGGRGFASGGIAYGVQKAHEAHDLISWARLRQYEWRWDGEGGAWIIVGSDDLNYTLRNVVTHDTRKVGKTRTNRAQWAAMGFDRTQAWHDWPVADDKDKAEQPPEGWR